MARGRRPQGGDVGGTTPIDVTRGEATPVASASFDPGYDFGWAIDECTPADLVRGYCDTGIEVGDEPPAKTHVSRRGG